MPSIINNKSRGGEDSIETNASSEAKNVVDIVSVEKENNMVIAYAEEKVVVDLDVSSILEGMNCA